MTFDPIIYDQVILSHIPEDNEDVDYKEEGNWQKPLRDGHKDFVAHPFYQQYFWRSIQNSIVIDGG